MSLQKSLLIEIINNDVLRGRSLEHFAVKLKFYFERLPLTRGILLKIAKEPRREFLFYSKLQFLINNQINKNLIKHMKKRTKTGQRNHDETVLKTANWYKSQGYNVKADLPEHTKPKDIGGFIPDLIARKKGREVIVEIETKDTDKKDFQQQEAFKNYASKDKSKTFRKKVV